MAIVIVADQRDSSHSPDRVAETAATLNTRFRSVLRLPFVRTAGDEMQALLDAPDALAPLVSDLLVSGVWWVGIGLGEIDRLGPSSRESAGPAFRSARRAIDAAKRERSPSGRIAVAGEPPRLARQLQAAATALDFILDRRTARQQAIVDAMGEHADGQAVATALGVSRQTVSKVLASGGYGAERQLAGLIGDLATDAT